MKKNILCYLLALLLMLSLVLVACDDGQQDPDVQDPDDDDDNITQVLDTIDMIDGWAGNADEEIYDFGSDGDDLVIDYNKSGAAWAYFRYNLAVFEVDTLANMSTFVFTVDFSMSAGSARTFIKVEYVDNSADEIKFDLVEGTHTYEWDLSSINLTNAARIVFFIDAGGETGVGTLTFSEIYMTKDAINMANAIDIIAAPDADTVAKNVYTEGDTFTANSGWYDSGDGVYDIEQNGDDYVVAYDKGNYEWASLVGFVSGDLSNMNKVTFTFTGEYGARVTVKVFDKIEYERKIFLTGEKQTLEVSLATTPSTAVDWTVDNMIYIMPEGGTAQVSGQITIHSVEFSTEYTADTEVEDVIEEPTRLDIGSSNWTGDISTDSSNVYALSDTDGALTIDYDKSLGQASSAVSISPESISQYKYAVLTLCGEAGKTATISVDGGVMASQEVVFDGQLQTVRLAIADNSVLSIVAESQSADGSGAITLYSIYLQDTDAFYVTEVNKTGWMANVASVYTLALQDGILKINYSKSNNPYAGINRTDAFMESYNQVIVTMTIPEGVTVLLSLDLGVSEQMAVVGTGVEQIIVLDNSGNNTKLTINVEADSTGVHTGNILVHSIVYGTAGEDMPLIPGVTTDVELDSISWLNVVSGYTVTVNEDNTLDVTVAKSASYPDGFMAWQDSNLAEYDSIVIGFVGEEGVEYTFRTTNGGTLTDVVVVATGEQQTVEIEISNNIRFHIYAMMGQTEGSTAYKINSIQLKVFD